MRSSPAPGLAGPQTEEETELWPLILKAAILSPALGLEHSRNDTCRGSVSHGQVGLLTLSSDRQVSHSA